MAISPLPLPPLWRESRLGLEAAALLRSRVFKGEGVEHADGQPVMLIPGFLAGDDSLGVMTQWLRRTGHHTKSAGMRICISVPPNVPTNSPKIPNSGWPNSWMARSRPSSQP